MINKVILIGHLTADPEVHASPKGVYVAKLRVATNSYAGKDEEGKSREDTQFHSLVAFGKTAEFAGNHLAKGRLIYVDGRLSTSSWDDPAGQKRYRTEVVVDTIQALGTKPASVAA